MTRRLLLLAVVFAAMAPAARAATPPALTQLPGLNACISQDGTDPARDNQQVCTIGSGLGDPTSIAISPDGRNAYVAGFDGTLSLMSRDSATGALSPLGCFSSSAMGTCTHARELEEADTVVVSPDGQNVYVGGDDGRGGIAVFERDPATGLLNQPADTSGCVAEVDTGQDCMLGKMVSEPSSLAITSDGKWLYSADGRGGVAVLRRAADGSLSQSTDPRTGCISEDGNDDGNLALSMPCVDGKELGGTFGLAISPNGQQVYVSDFNAGIAILQRDSTTGELSQSIGMDGCISEGGNDGNTPNICTPGIGLNGAGSVLVAPDGGHVYTTAFFSNGVALLDRDPATGDLTQKPGTAGCITEDGSDGIEGPSAACSVGRNLTQAFGIAMSPDGTKLYVGSSVSANVLANAAHTRGLITGAVPHASGGVTLFDRDPATGSLQQPAGAAGCVNEVGGRFSPSVPDACAAGIALQSVGSLAISPDATNLYAASADSQAVAEFGPPLPAPPVAPPARDTTAPSVSRLTLTHRVFAVAHAATPVSARVRGTTFRFRLSEQSAVKIAIKRALPGKRVGKRCVKPTARNRHRHACTRFVAAGTLRRSEKAGAVSVKFSGRIGKRALKPGRYRATITATDAAGNVSKPRSVDFRIIR